MTREEKRRLRQQQQQSLPPPPEDPAAAAGENQATASLRAELALCGIGEPTLSELAAMPGLTARIVRLEAARAKTAGKGSGALVLNLRAAASARPNGVGGIPAERAEEVYKLALERNPSLKAYPRGTTNVRDAMSQAWREIGEAAHA